MDRTVVNSLMEVASAGDDHAYAALASAVQDELYRFALAHGLAPERAEDATQEVLMRAYARRSAWKPNSDAMAWLYGFAVNVIRESKRKESRQRGLWQGWRAGPEPQTAEPELTTPPDLDELEQLQAALAKLPPRQREAIACRYLRRMTVRETAEAMGCAEGTVKSAVSAALDRLRATLRVFEEA